MRRPALFFTPPAIPIGDEPLGDAALIAAGALLSSDAFEIVPAWQARPPRRLRRLSAAVSLDRGSLPESSAGAPAASALTSSVLSGLPPTPPSPLATSSTTTQVTGRMFRLRSRPSRH